MNKRVEIVYKFMTSLHVSFQAGPREVVAIKCILKSTLNKASTENLLTEIELLKNLKHQHIVALKDFLVGSVFIYKLVMWFLVTQVGANIGCCYD